MARTGEDWVPAPFPPALIRALMQYVNDPKLEKALQDGLDFQLDARRRQA